MGKNQVPIEVESAIQQYLKSCEERKDKEKKAKLFRKLWNKKSLDFIINSTQIDCKKLENRLKADERFIHKVKSFFEKNSILENCLNIEDLKIYIRKMFCEIFDVEKYFEADENINKKVVNELELNKLDHIVINDDRYMTYALCHHCYCLVKEAPEKYVIEGKCYRHEDYLDIFRKEKFTMVEMVLFSSPLQLEDYRNKIIYLEYFLVKGLFSNYKFCIANDSFISDAPDLLLYQFLNKTKLELQIYDDINNKYIAVSSINMHMKSFTKKYKICTCDGKMADSMCVGIGIDRLFELIRRIESK